MIKYDIFVFLSICLAAIVNYDAGVSPAGVLFAGIYAGLSAVWLCMLIGKSEERYL